MSEKRNRMPEICGECYKSFSYNDWAKPIEALILHKATECTGPRKRETT